MDAHSNVALALPSLDLSLAHVSDDEVLARTRRLVGRSNLLLAELLAHLAEVEARGIHRTRACSSLYAYCMYELRFSEDEAFRRVAAARLVRRFPVLLDALASGELHLTGLLMLGPHLTDANLTEVLARAKHRTKRELARLVRVLDPLPSVPARIEPLGPAPARAIPADPTWAEFVQSFCPVRELAPGERPRDWMGNASDTGTNSVETSDAGTCSVQANDTGEELTTTDLAAPATPARVTSTAPDPTGAGYRVPESLAPERYKVQFTATAEYVRLVEEAKALLAHAAPRASLDEIHLRALRAFVTLLRKQKYAIAETPSHQAHPDVAGEPPTAQREQPTFEPAPVEEGTEAHQPRQGRQDCQRRQRGRYIPAAVRRAVFKRDGQQCTHTDRTGRRCTETHRLEFHHLEPFARGGEHTVANLALRCAAHNSLAAENDYGRERIEVAKARNHAPGDDFAHELIEVAKDEEPCSRSGTALRE
jgi:5-methylcytosine-specific restriction endonuclease McrA